MEKLFDWEYLNIIFEKKVWIKENIYMMKTMEKYYPCYGKICVSHSFFKSVKRSINFEIFRNHISELNSNILYYSYIHGIKHILNVTFFSYLLGCNENLPPNDMDVLLEVALYHDIGRINDKEDSEHGLRGAIKIMKQMPDDKINVMVPALIHAHSLLDGEANSVFEQYFLEKAQYNRYLTLLSIIKDADALDRFRLTPNSLNPKYFRIDYSNKLISLACVLSKVVYYD